MIRNSRSISVALFATTALITPQTAKAATPAPQFTVIDQNGVDVTSALPFVSFDEGGIGTGPGALRMRRTWAAGAGWADNWTGGLFTVTSGGVTKYYVQLSGMSDVFTLSGGVFTSDQQMGASLATLLSGDYLYTARDGTTVEFLATPFNRTDIPCAGADANSCRVPITITKANGQKFNFTYDTGLSVFKRLSGVSSSAGYSLSITYQTNNPGTGSQPVIQWYQRTSVTFTNSASPPSPLPTITYDNNHGTVTDPAGFIWTLQTVVHRGNLQLAQIQAPNNGRRINYTYDGNGNLQQATDTRGATTTYSRVINGTTATLTSTDALTNASVAVVDLTKGRMTSFANPLNRTTSYLYDSNSRLTRTTVPEGNYTELTYDSRGNVTQARQAAKSGSGLADVITSANFDATCSNIVTCNQPNTTTDAKGNVTNYTYDPTHGGALTVTQPAPIVGGVRPQTRDSYSQITSASGDLVYMLTGISACQTTSSCTGTSDEIKTTTTYNSNLLPTTVSNGDGTGALTATTTNTFYPTGDLNTVDGPLPGTADTTKYRYDALDQVIGIVGPDPDGAGSLKMRATRITYRPDRQVSKREIGTVNSQSDPDWALFSPLQTLDIAYDTSSRKQTEKLSAGGTLYTQTDYSYDADGRPDCTAARMNPPATNVNACTQSTAGSYGPDRISEVFYDAAGHIRHREVAVGASGHAYVRNMTYSINGLPSTLLDANNNLTTFEYDGFDRLSKTRYPDPTHQNQSSTTDYELLGYDANSNVTSRRIRDGNTIGFTFDNLNRVTLKDLPGAEPDVGYGYDNLGRLVSAAQTGNSLAFTYDALGRKLTESGPQGTVTSQYDLAGRRTQITYPGTGLYVNYDYLLTGETIDARENGATTGVGVLASYSYDNLGNRTGVVFGNGVIQAFGRDPVSRLSSLTNDLSGTTNDLSATFAYNPASQIAQMVRTGDSYAFTQIGSGSTTYVPNGLNQQVTIGGASATWDAKGNLASDPTSGKTYGYSSENLLTSASGSVVLIYDPQKRLYEEDAASTTRLAYDGVDAIAEYDGTNTLLRRYVFANGIDDPIVWYEGTGTTDRRFMSTDERGSIISFTDSSGSLIGINRYDEYGRPQTTNIGRFQYTGQMWLSDLGAYYYKARVYLSHLGIFAQTDPAGYDPSPNLYAYVGNSPISATDPSGQATMIMCEGGPWVPSEHGGGMPSASDGCFDITVPDESGNLLNPYSQEPLLGGEDQSLNGLPFGAAANGPNQGGGYLCLGICQSRTLSAQEQTFYQSMGITSEATSSAILFQGLPPVPYMDPSTMGYTLDNDVYLRNGISSAFASPYQAGLIGHELVHVEQYSQGYTIFDFGYEYAVYGPFNSPLEVPAYQLQNTIQTCRAASTC